MQFGDMGTSADRYPNLFQVLGGYLHEDWTDEHASVDAVLSMQSDVTLRTKGPDPTLQGVSPGA